MICQITAMSIFLQIINSQDNTLDILKDFAKKDRRIKIIANATNFGPTRSVFNAILASSGAATVVIAADLQDPPELIKDFLVKWENDYKVVFGLRKNREEGFLLRNIRRAYYRILNSMSEEKLVNDAGDFFLIDKCVVELLRQVKTINPYIRGLIAGFGFPTAGIPYNMVKRRTGKSAGSITSYFIYAMNGFINHTLFPLRFISIAGLVVASLSFLFAVGQFIASLLAGSPQPTRHSHPYSRLVFPHGNQLLHSWLSRRICQFDFYTDEKPSSGRGD